MKRKWKPLHKIGYILGLYEILLSGQGHMRRYGYGT